MENENKKTFGNPNDKTNSNKYKAGFRILDFDPSCIPHKITKGKYVVRVDFFTLLFGCIETQIFDGNDTNTTLSTGVVGWNKYKNDLYVLTTSGSIYKFMNTQMANSTSVNSIIEMKNTFPRLKTIIRF
jgi:hypothetical protein